MVLKELCFENDLESGLILFSLIYLPFLMIFKESNHENLFAYVVVVVVVASIKASIVVVFVVTVFGLINVTDNTMLVQRRRSTKIITTICLVVRNLFIPC